MKKIFKALAIAAASTALCAGIATATACDAGYNGTYEGDYHYTNQYNQTYGMKVKVTVENNIITKVEDVTNGAYTTVSKGWAYYYADMYNANWYGGTPLGDVVPEYQDEAKTTLTADSQKKIEAIDHSDTYGWDVKNVNTWNNDEAWLLQMYEGKSVADVLAVKVFVKTTGEPYSSDKNDFTVDGDNLLITGSTQGSGRLLLAVQNALKNK